MSARMATDEDLKVIDKLRQKIREVVAEGIRVDGLPPGVVATVLSVELGHVCCFVFPDGETEEQRHNTIIGMIHYNLELGQNECKREFDSGVHPYLEAALDGDLGKVG